MSKKVLLADDSVTIQKVVALIFAAGDYDLECAGNGDAAIEKARSARPDIILADVNMPQRDGYELCSAIKHDPALADVPVLLLAGTFEPFDEEKARSAGADGWISKPFESQSLIDEVEGMLSRAKAAALSKEVSPAPEKTDAIEQDMLTELEFESLDLTDEGEIALEESDITELESESWVDEEFLCEESLQENQVVPMASQSSIEDPERDSLEAFLGENVEESEPVKSATPPSDDEILFLDESDLLEDEDEPVDDFSFDLEADTFSGASVSTVEEKLEEPEKPALESFEVAPMEDDSSASSAAFAEESEEPASAATFAPEFSGVATDRSSEAPTEEDSPGKRKIDGLSFFRNSGLIAKLTSPIPEPVQDLPFVENSASYDEDQIVAQTQTLSEEQLERIVERVAGTIIERLAGSVLERIVWEVVPDLAEGMIKEEIRKITETSC